MNEHPASESGQEPPAAAPAEKKVPKAPRKAKAKDKPVTTRVKAKLPTKKTSAAAKPVARKVATPAKAAAAKPASGKKIAVAVPKGALAGPKRRGKAVSIDTKVTVNVGGRKLEFTLNEAEDLSNELDRLFKRVQPGPQRK